MSTVLQISALFLGNSDVREDQARAPAEIMQPFPGEFFCQNDSSPGQETQTKNP
jgi:hypothetical protein